MNRRATHSFELTFTAPPGEGTIDALYEAGWDDATVMLDPVAGGPGVATFDRDATSADEAIASAIRQGRSAGVEVTGVTKARPDLESAPSTMRLVSRGKGLVASTDEPLPTIDVDDVRAVTETVRQRSQPTAQ